MADDTKLTLGADPALELLSTALREVEVTDVKGRKIKLAKPGVLAQFHLVKMLGENASNQTYVGMVLPLLFVVGIDGQAVFRPNTEREMDALIQRLDEEGIAAVAEGVQEHWGKTDLEAAKSDLRK